MQNSADTASTSWYPAHYGFALSAVKNACQVLRSFYNYLLYHNVCPEYQNELDVARNFCDVAEQELPKVHAAGLALPGDFNKSASAIFGGTHAGLYTGDKLWAENMKKEGVNIGEMGIRDEEARIKFTVGVAIIASDEQYERVEAKSMKVVRKTSVGLEVISIHAPNALVKDTYAKESKVLQNKLGELEPLGKLICKTWYIEDCDEWDLPKDKVRYPDGKPRKLKDNTEYEFWIEERVLEECFVGMKMDAEVLMLDGGLIILDNVKETMCSGFTWLPNELWMEKKPKEVRWMKKGLGLDNEEEIETEGAGKDDKNKDGFEDEFDDQ